MPSKDYLRTVSSAVPIIMKKDLIQPQQQITFDAKPYGYVVQIRKQLWTQPVQFMAQDSCNNQTIASGNVESHRFMHEFRVCPEVALTLANTGEWPLVIKWL